MRIKINFLIFLIIVFPGCTTVTISSDGKEISCNGILKTSLNSEDSNLVQIKTNGIGLFRSNEDITLGWLSETRIFSTNHPDKCRVILLPENTQNIESFIQTLTLSGINLSDICTLKKGTHDEKP